MKTTALRRRRKKQKNKKNKKNKNKKKRTTSIFISVIEELLTKLVTD